MFWVGDVGIYVFSVSVCMYVCEWHGMCIPSALAYSSDMCTLSKILGPQALP